MPDKEIKYSGDRKADQQNGVSVPPRPSENTNRPTTKEPAKKGK